MRRREFLTLVSGVAAGLPFAAVAQKSKVPQVGALHIGLADAESFKNELRDGLRELGYVEGKTLRLSFDPPKESWINFPTLHPNWSGSLV